MAEKNRSSAMRNAEASIRMEGAEVTPEMREKRHRVLDGKTTTADALTQLPSEHERQSLRNALDSICMEVFEVTEQTAKDYLFCYGISRLALPWHKR